MLVSKQYVQGLILLEAKNNYGKDGIKYQTLIDIENRVYDRLREVFDDVIIDATYYTDDVFKLENKLHLTEKDCMAKFAVDEEKFKSVHEKNSPSNYIFSSVISETEKALKKPTRSKKAKINL